MIATVAGISMNESNVPILIVVAVLLAIGVVLLLQRISAKHRSDPAKRTLQTEMVPSSLTDTPRDPTQDKTSIERMLKGETQRRDESVSRPTASARDDPATEQTLRKSKPPIRALMVGRWELAYIQSEDLTVLSFDVKDEPKLNVALSRQDADQIAKAILEKLQNPHIYRHRHMRSSAGKSKRLW